MKANGLWLVLVVAAALVGLLQAQGLDANKTTTSTEGTTVTTEANTTTITTSTVATSTPAESTTTSLPESTTTVTTEKTTTTASPTTTPVPPPERGNWTVTIGNDTCIILSMAADLVLPYKKGDKEANVTIDIPRDAKSNGSCGNDTQAITLTWGDGAKNRLEIRFRKEAASYYVSDLLVVVDPSQFPESQTTALNASAHGVTYFKAPAEKSYKCGPTQPLPLNVTDTNDKNSTVLAGVLKVQDLQLQAFHKGKTDKYGESFDCEHEKPSDVVPIAVGVALAVLVVIVLIAYLIGRRRSRARGYQSV